MSIPDAFQFIGYLFLHAFVVYVTLGRLYLVDAVIASIRANMRDKHGAGWVLFITNFITGHVETFLSLYSVKICFSATAPCLASLIASVQHFIAEQRLRPVAPVETQLRTAYLREGQLFFSFIPLHFLLLILSKDLSFRRIIWTLCLTISQPS
jgi:hypothetical protein